MFILPFTTKSAVGFSICPIAKSLLTLSGIISLLSASSIYHSTLYGYSVPDWALPISILCILPFGIRTRVALSNDKKTLKRQIGLFGIKVYEWVYKDVSFNKFNCIRTDAIDNQYYFLVQGEEKYVSVHYCKINAKKVSAMDKKLNLMLGL